MNKKLIIISLVLAMIAGVLGLAISVKPVQAAGVGTIYAAVTDENHISTSADGSTATFTVQIMVDGGSAQYNVARCYLTWDPTALAIDSITSLPSAGTSDYTTSFKQSSGSGWLDVSRGKTGTPLTGITKLVQVTFHHIAASASTTLVIDNSKSHIVEYDTLNELLNPATGTTTIATYHTQWTVTVQVNGTASTNPNHTFTGTTNHTGTNYVVHNSSFAVTYTPETGTYVSHVSSLTDGGVSKSFTATGGTYTNSTVTASSTIVVTFAPNTFNITTSVASPSGTIDASQVVNYGATNISFLMSANTGYYIQKYAVDSVDSTTGVGVRDSSYTYTYTFAGPITADHTLAAYFTVRVFNITLNVGANGTMTGAVTVNYGGNSNYTIQGNGTATSPNYEIASLTDNATPVPAAVGQGQGAGVYNTNGAYTYTLSNVTADHTLATTYRQIDLTPGAATGSNGTTSFSYPQATYLYSGDTLTITLVPAAGYYVNSLTNNGVTVVPGTSGNSTTTIVTGSGLPGARNETLVITITNIQRKPVIAVNYGGTYSVTVVITGTPSTNPNKTFTGTTNHTGVNYVVDGGTLAITYTPDADALTSSIVDSVTGSQTPVAAGGTYTTSAVTANRTVTITFVPKTYTITSSVVSSHGTITGSMVVNQGATNLSFEMTADIGYYITTYSVNGTPSTVGVNNRDTSNSYTYTFTGPITSNQTISVTYSIKVYNITLTPGANGTLTGPLTANYGTSPSYTIQGDGTATTANYEITSLTDNGTPVPAAVGLGEGAGVYASSGAYTYTINNITADHTLVTAYNKIVLTPGSITGANGTSTFGPATLYSGDTITLTLTPSTGYHVDSLTNNGAAVTPGTSGNSATTISATLPATTDALRDAAVTVTITNIQRQPTVAVTYSKNTYHLTLINQGANATGALGHVPASGATGAGTLNGVIAIGAQATVDKLYQDSLSVPFAPAAGSYIYDLQLDGASIDATGTPYSKKTTFGLATFRAGGSRSFASIAGDHTLRAIYEKLGDVTLNGTVDFDDAIALSAKWDTTDTTSYYVTDRANSDFNADNISNDFDASLIMEYWS